MEETKVVLNEHNIGEIVLYSDGHKAGKMDIAVKNNLLPVYHTEVNEEYNGKGFAKLLLDKLVSYARGNNLKVVPLCPYVYAQFKRHPEEYEDIWFKREV